MVDTADLVTWKVIASNYETLLANISTFVDARAGENTTQAVIRIVDELRALRMLRVLAQTPENLIASIRQVESERDTARAEVERLRAALLDACTRLSEARTERDEAIARRYR